MPRIYKPVGPTSNKAAGPSETKAPAAPVQGQLDEKKASAKSNNLFDKFAKSTVIEPITIEKPEF